MCFFADDSQLYKSSVPSDFPVFACCLKDCIEDVAVCHHILLTFFIYTIPLGHCALLTALCWQYLTPLLWPLKKILLCFWTHCLELPTTIPPKKTVFHNLKRNLRPIYSYVLKCKSVCQFLYVSFRRCVCVCVCVSLSLSPSLWKSMFMCPHPLVCVCALVRKTVYECLIRCSLMQTCLPKSTFVSTPNSLCPYFQIFLQDFYYAPPINQTQKKLSKDNFSLIHLYEQCVNSYFQLYRCSAKLAHYETGTLWHSDAYILFTSAKVNGCFISKTIENLSCLYLRKSFSIEDHRTLSPKAMHHVCCFHWCRCVLSWMVVWQELVSLVSCILNPIRRFCAATCHRKLWIQTPHIWRRLS